MNLGTGDKKKVWILCALGVAAAYFFYTNVIAGPDSGQAPAPRAARETAEEPLYPPAAGTSAGVPAGIPANYGAPARAGAPATSRGRGDEFHPVLHSRRAEDRVDPMTIDPTLRLDLLAKLQNEEATGGSRNLFQFGQTPPPKAELPKGPEPKVVPTTFIGPRQPGVQNESAREAPAPPPPPITFKYYGYSTARANGKKTAFFLDGDEILVAGEGDTVKRRYRVVRIGVSSVTMEDVESKRQQPLALAEEAGG
jgi:hypothetical protein